MDLFCFASRSVENIRLGVRHRMWAVATVSDKAMRNRISKARNHLRVGSHGVLYCNPTSSFTTPFIVESPADPDSTITDVWPEPWVLPFRIRPLGDPSRQVHMDDAWERWPVLRDRERSSGGVSAAMNITGVTVFVPVMVTDEDWALILRDLAVPGVGGPPDAEPHAAPDPAA